MEKLEMRARARATARANRLFTPGRDDRIDSAAEPRGRSTAPRMGTLPPPVDIIDEAQARAACKPMGELEFIVQSADARGRIRAMYVIVPDLALKEHYQRLGLAVEAGCRVLLDAAALLPIAVLRVSCRNGEGTPSKCDGAAGFNPYWDMPAS
jgi:hypothetical protein